MGQLGWVLRSGSKAGQTAFERESCPLHPFPRLPPKASCIAFIITGYHITSGVHTCFRHTTPATVSFREGGVCRAGLMITYAGVNFCWHHLDQGCCAPPAHKVEVNSSQLCGHRGLTFISAGSFVNFSEC